MFWQILENSTVFLIDCFYNAHVIADVMPAAKYCFEQTEGVVIWRQSDI